jgi:hypothetical protein
MNEDLLMIPVVCGMFSWFAWLIFTTIRRAKIAKLQAETQKRLLDGLGSSQELLAYAQTETGKRLLESLRVEQTMAKSPHLRILSAVQAGIVMLVFGLALLFLRLRVSGSDAQQVLLVFGTLILALGAGFVISAAVSYFLSKSFGLLNGTPAEQA